MLYLNRRAHSFIFITESTVLFLYLDDLHSGLTNRKEVGYAHMRRSSRVILLIHSLVVFILAVAISKASLTPSTGVLFALAQLTRTLSI